MLYWYSNVATSLIIQGVDAGWAQERQPDAARPPREAAACDPRVSYACSARPDTFSAEAIGSQCRRMDALDQASVLSLARLFCSTWAATVVFVGACSAIVLCVLCVVCSRRHGCSMCEQCLLCDSCLWPFSEPWRFKRFEDDCALVSIPVSNVLLQRSCSPQPTASSRSKLGRISPPKLRRPPTVSFVPEALMYSSHSVWTKSDIDNSDANGSPA